MGQRVDNLDVLPERDKLHPRLDRSARFAGLLRPELPRLQCLLLHRPPSLFGLPSRRFPLPLDQHPLQIRLADRHWQYDCFCGAACASACFAAAAVDSAGLRAAPFVFLSAGVGWNSVSANFLRDDKLPFLKGSGKVHSGDCGERPRDRLFSRAIHANLRE